jgi:hypothetical protein
MLLQADTQATKHAARHTVVYIDLPNAAVAKWLSPSAFSLADQQELTRMLLYLDRPWILAVDRHNTETSVYRDHPGIREYCTARTRTPIGGQPHRAIGRQVLFTNLPGIPAQATPTTIAA